jgi:hypothetical protein
MIVRLFMILKLYCTMSTLGIPIICTLTPKGPSPFFSKNTPNLPFLAQEAQTNTFFTYFHFQLRDLALDYYENMYKKFQKS